MTIVLTSLFKIKFYYRWNRKKMTKAQRMDRVKQLKAHHLKLQAAAAEE